MGLDERWLEAGSATRVSAPPEGRGGRLRFAPLVLVVGLWACAGAPQPGPEAAQAGASSGASAPASTLAASLPNGAEATPGIYTAGALSPSHLDEAAEAGVGTVIDLRTAAEKSFDERAEAEARGMRYVAIEVDGAAGLTRENVERLDAALQEGGPFVVHCGSSNRVGALFALRAGWLQDADVEQALAVGRARGLTKLEPAVRERLEAAPAASP